MDLCRLLENGTVDTDTKFHYFLHLLIFQGFAGFSGRFLHRFRIPMWNFVICVPLPRFAAPVQDGGKGCRQYDTL